MAATRLTETEKRELELESQLEASLCKFQRDLEAVWRRREAKLDEIMRLILDLSSSSQGRSTTTAEKHSSSRESLVREEEKTEELELYMALPHKDSSSNGCESRSELSKFANHLNFQKSIAVDRASADEDLIEQHSRGSYEERDMELKISKFESCDTIKNFMIMNESSGVTNYLKKEKKYSNEIDYDPWVYNSFEDLMGTNAQLHEESSIGSRVDVQSWWYHMKAKVSGVASEVDILSPSHYSTAYQKVEKSAGVSNEIEIAEFLKRIDFLKSVKPRKNVFLPPARENAQLKEPVVSLSTPVICNFASKWLLDGDHKPKVKMKLRAQHDEDELYEGFDDHRNGFLGVGDLASPMIESTWEFKGRMVMHWWKCNLIRGVVIRGIQLVCLMECIPCQILEVVVGRWQLPSGIRGTGCVDGFKEVFSW